MKKYLLIFCCLLMIKSKAQSLSPGGFASVAGSYSNPSSNLEFNFGETVIGNFLNGNTLITLGTLQPDNLGSTIPLTQLRSIDCGKLNLSPDAQIMAIEVPSAILYQFEFRDASTGFLYGQRITSTKVITPAMVQPALVWNQQYLVRVKVFLGGQWGQFGNTCSVGMMQDPSITGVPFAAVRAKYCNNNINLSNGIVCDPVTMANRYEFNFTNSQNGIVHNYVSLTTTCVLSQVNPPLTSGVLYQVQVRARVYTTWGNFGNSCNITPIVSSSNRENNLLVDDTTFIASFSENTDIDNYSKLSVFPNPVNENTNLLIESSKDEIVYFKIFDMQGNLLSTFKGITNYPTLLVEELSKGTYSLVAITNSGVYKTTKIIKIN